MEYITLLVTILLGIPGILIYLNQKKSKLFFIKDKQINLQDDLLKNFENLTIKYEDTEINDKITFIKGYILYTGDKDIIEKENVLEIYNESISWLNFKITNVSKGLTVKSAIENEKIVVEFGLLKNNEFFEFEGLINNNNESESKDQSNINLKFFHRIPNIPQIEELDKSLLEKTNNIFYLGLLLLLMGGYALNDSSKMDSYMVKVYNAKTNLEVDDYYNFRATTSYEKIITQLNRDYIGYEMFFVNSKNYNITYNGIDNKEKKVSIYFKRDDYMSLFFAIISLLFILVGGFLILGYFVTNYQKKYIKILNVNR